ncbi:hypothetical protein DFH09DRAFT_159551 [Mycena vulgaris]|nr:hypothetical protein DFH09DRAFT_159551 [Mycena vulgaris]
MVAMSLQIASPLGIPELLDLIMDQLANSSRALYSCAVVSKLWQRRAQYHLFRNIAVTGALRNRPDMDERVIPRLVETLTSSPHLAALVRSIVVSLDISVLGLVAQLSLPRLREVTIYCTWDQRVTRADRAAVADVQKILRTPTLLIVNLEGYFPSIPVLNEYFQGCSRSIVTLKGIPRGRFTELVAPNETTDSAADDDSEEAPGDENAPPKLNLVALAAAPRLGRCLASPECPFAFSRLVMLVVTEAYWPVLQRTLAPSLPHLEHLKLLMFDGAEDVDLRALPLLRKFKVSCETGARDLPALHAVLARLPPTNRIAVATVRLHAISTDDEAHFKRFDADVVALSETVLHALERVEFDLPLAQCMPLDNSVSVPSFKAWLPLLGKKKWLDVVRR